MHSLVLYLSRGLCFRLAILGWSALLPQLAAAQPSPAERETARSLMDEADSMRAAGDHYHALERYRAADAIMGVPTTGLEVARTQAQLMQWVEASATAITVANLPVRPGEPKVFAEARTAAATLANELAPRIPSVRVTVEPAGMEYSVTIDGLQLPDAARALPFKLNPGNHTVVVQAPGYLTSSSSLMLVEAQLAPLKVTLTPGAAPTPYAQYDEARSNVWNAGQDDGELPPVLQPRRDEAGDPNAAGRMRGYVGLSVGGVVLSVGVVAGIVAAIQTSDIKDRCSGTRCPPSTQSDIDGASTLSNVANVTLALGLLGVGYGLIELLTHPRESSERASSSRPPLSFDVSLDRPGFSVRGTL